MKAPDFLVCYYETTRRCDQGCPHCMTERDPAPAGPELSTEEAKRLVLDELKAICPRGAVSFSGGEVLQRDDHLELIAHNARNGLYSFVNTSGSRLDASGIKKLKRAASGRLTMGFSLDSVEDGIQRKCRSGGQEHLERLLKLCDDAGVPHFVLVTISKRNLSSLQSTIGWLREKKIELVRSPFVPRGAAAKARHLCFDRDDMENTIHPALRNFPLGYVSYTPFFASPDATRLTLGGRTMSLGNLGCQAGRTLIGINAEGDVAPCIHLLDTPVTCGNVRERPLSGIFNESEVMLALRGERPAGGKCGQCRYGDSCRGCRALAYHHSGDYLAEDPSCFFDPDSMDERSPYEDMQTANTRIFLDHMAHHRPWSDIFGARGRMGVTLLDLKSKFSAILRG